MRYLSVCSGIEAATVAWKPLGWEAVAFSEIEPFPCAVLKHHYPDTPLQGDFTTIKEDEYGAVDIVVGGTPCQSFSIAGLRGGLDDDRGNLALQYFKLVARTRPRWVVWENVPGVLSSGEGRDFGSIIGALDELRYGWAYRILDAQYFGVAQRRRRVFVVGYLGGWAGAAAVLFERDCLSGNPAPSREKGSGPAGTLEARAGTGGYDPGAHGAASGHLIASPLSGVPYADNGTHESKLVVADAQKITGAVSSKWAKGTGGPSGDECYNLVTVYENHMQDSRVKDCGDLSPQINAKAGTGGGNLPIIFSANIARNGSGQPSALAPTLKANTKSGDTEPLVAFQNRFRGDDGRGYDRAPHSEKEMVGALDTVKGWNVAGPYLVRRLTPIECERLQGFPDDYTRIPYRGKAPEECPDGPRYKALGNSMAVPVMRWLGMRIKAVDALLKAQAA